MWLVSLENDSLIEVTNCGSWSCTSPSHHAKSWVSSGLDLGFFVVVVGFSCFDKTFDESNLKKEGLTLSPSLEV